MGPLSAGQFVPHRAETGFLWLVEVPDHEVCDIAIPEVAEQLISHRCIHEPLDFLGREFVAEIRFGVLDKAFGIGLTASHWLIVDTAGSYRDLLM